MSDPLMASRHTWEIMWQRLLDVHGNAEAARDPESQRQWLQALIGMCDTMKAASVSYSSAIGYDSRKK